MISAGPLCSRRDSFSAAASHRSGDIQITIEAGIAPDLRGYAAGEYIGGIPDILKANVKRREAKAHDVGRPKVADHTALDHRLHHRITLVEGYPDLAATQCCLAGCHNIKARQKRGN